LIFVTANRIKLFIPTAKGYFSGCGGLELGIIQAGINVIQSLELDNEAVSCMKTNRHYFSQQIIPLLFI